MNRFVLLLTSIGCYIFCFCITAYSQTADIYTGTIDIYVNSYGKIQLYSTSPTDTVEQLERASVLVGTGPNAVFDYQNDQDVEDSTMLLATPSWGDYEIYGTYNNNYSGLPPNVLIKQSVFAWQNGSYAIVKWTVVDREDSSIDAILGLDLIPQVDNSYLGNDTVTYTSTSGIISDHKTSYVGFKMLSEDIKALGMFVYYSDYTEDTTYWRYLSSTEIDSLLITDPNDPDVDDPVIIPSLNSKTIASGDSITVFWAMAYGANDEDMQNSIAAAVSKYNEATDVKNPVNSNPSDYILNQNYPNPFNPSTIISFTLPERETVTLDVYNLLGQKVVSIINKVMDAGKYDVKFNADNLSAGIYFYSLKTNNFVSTKKMMLLK